MTHTKPNFLELKLLTLKELFFLKVGLLMFNPLTAKLLNWNFHPLEVVSR